MSDEVSPEVPPPDARGGEAAAKLETLGHEEVENVAADAKRKSTNQPFPKIDDGLGEMND